MRLYPVLFLAVIFSSATGGAARCGSEFQGSSKPKPAPLSAPTIQNPLPPANGHLNDLAHALNDDTRQQVEQALVEFQKRSKIDFAVAVVNTTEGKPLGEYAKAVFQGWNIGGSGEGLLLLFATDDRVWRLHSNRGVARDLPEDKIREVGASMSPSLGREQYNDAVRKGVEGIIKIIADKRGFAPIKIPAPLLPS